MTTTDWLLDIALLLLVLRQVRESRAGLHFVLLSLGIVGYVAHSYLHSVPTAGNDVSLIAILTTVGAMLGIGSGLATRVRFDGKHILAKAGWVAAGLWVLGMGLRLAFQVWASHGGGPALDTFSRAHDITTAQAWVAGLVLMALAEVTTRIAVIMFRGYRVSHNLAAARQVQLPQTAAARI